jgi:AraC-like DNA-binding protein
MARADRILAGDGLRAVVRAVEVGHADIPHDASLMEQARLIVCLEGTAWFQLQGKDKVAEAALRPGDALFVAPGRWVKANPRQPYVSMGIVLYAGSTRFYLMRGRPTRPGSPVETCVVPDGIGEEGRALVRMLAGAAPALAGERFFRNAAECLLIAARARLDRPAGEAPGKARFTWQAACDYLEDNLQRPLSRKDVARFLRVHPNHLSRLFAEFSREPFALYLQDRRLERARLLLADPRLNISEVARLSGFANANYFIRVFRQRTGHTPTRARRNQG